MARHSCKGEGTSAQALRRSVELAPAWDPKSYRRFRQTYPDSIYQRVYEFAGLPRRQLAVDVGCGSGQVTERLAQDFEAVVGIDCSEQQLRLAPPPPPNVQYVLGVAETTGLPPASVDLLTAGATIHWLDLPAFYREARRVLRPHGALAAWSYTGHDFPDHPAATKRLASAFQEAFRGYTHPGLLKLLNGHYHGLEPVQGRDFGVVEHAQLLDWEQEMSMEDLTGFLYSTSPYLAYLMEHGNVAAQEVVAGIVSETQQLLGLADQHTKTRVRYPVELILAKEPLPVGEPPSSAGATGASPS